MQTPSRRTIQAWSRRAALSVTGVIVVALSSEFVVALARERGYYEHPSRTLVAVFDFLLRNPFVHAIGGAILGFAVGVWVESLAQREELAAIPAQPTATSLPKPDARIGIIAKAREIAHAIRHAIENRDVNDATAFYEQFNTEAVDTMEILLRSLGGIPPVTRETSAAAVYWHPRRREALLLVAEDLELLADAVEEKVRGIPGA